jgi:hypothetical protein
MAARQCMANDGREKDMTTIRRLRILGLAGLSLGLASLTGCQTWVGGMTLPSGHYLEHPPQYFPPDPDFPLQRELNTQLEQDAAARAANPPAVIGPLPPAVVAPIPVAPAPVAPIAPAPVPPGVVPPVVPGR